jgi:ATP-dependent DNA ligase
MVIREEYLVSINSKNRIQRVKLQLDQNPFDKTYSILRVTGQYGGKETDQPIIKIEHGKVKRTISEQATLQFNALLKNYLDKGYVKLAALTSKRYSDLTEDEIKNLLGGNFVSDQSGVPKPMLAKLADQCSSDIWEKDWYVSRKLDGCRMLLYYKDGVIQTASRGGGNYNVATKHIREDKTLIEIFRQSPDLILDGELYRHGSDWPLQRISGLARLQEWKDDCAELEYWVYDYIDTTTPFKDRWKVLSALKTLIPQTSPIKILDQKIMSGYMSIKKEHDRYVQEGFEGLCARNPDKEYGVNKRSALYLIKLKERQDDEFEVIGVREGMRPEDMCFTLKTKEGKEFAAKPVGDVQSRLYFIEHKNEFIGKFATCTYFAISSDGIPTQPVLKSFRPDDE